MTLGRAALAEPAAILEWALATWGDALGFTTGLGPGGVAVLHLARSLRPNLQAIFLDTGFHFPDTLAYRDTLETVLDLPIVSVHPRPFGPTWREDRLACCDHRKVEPLERALAGHRAWVSARRRDQGGFRSELGVVERDARGFVKVNPLAHVDRGWVRSYLELHGIPLHPLTLRGYGSVGCEPCTRPLREGEGERDGRLFAGDKTECGIHTRLGVERPSVRGGDGSVPRAG